MTQEDKQLLLIDLCARLLYGVKVENTSFSEPQIHTLFGRVSNDEFLMLETYKSVSGEDYRRVTDDVHYTGYLESIKPYLRPMYSITEEERNEVVKLGVCYDCAFHNDIYDTGISMEEAFFVISWFLERHFDINHLIEKGLAIESKPEMYKI